MRHLGLIVVLYLALPVSGLGNPQEDQDRPCIPRDFGKGSVVCVCNSTYCDFSSVTIPLPDNPADGQSHRGLPVQVWTSSKSGSRLHKSIIYFSRDDQEDVYEANNFRAPIDKRRRTKQASQRRFGFLPSSPRRRSSSAGFLDVLFSALLPSNEIQFTDAVTQDYVPSLNELGLFYYVGDFPRPQKVTKFTVRPNTKYQRVLGFGGAFTDAAGINIASLSNSAQENLMTSYFGNSGINYNMGRVPIGGSDFSTRPYTLDDDKAEEPLPYGKDLNLTAFSLQPEDHEFKIPYIRWAQSLRNGSLKLLASAWSAPAWMKTRQSLKGRGELKQEYYQLWADYYVRFLQAYKEEGVLVWGVTTGNEPLNGFIPNWPFNCMGWRASDMRKWIASNLGPTLASLKPELDVKIITLDDNKGAIPTWAKEILDHQDAAQYVDGIGTHWYFDFLTGSDVLSRFHKKYPDYFIVQTEACLGFTPWELEKVILGSWERGEQYLEAIIRDMRNWVGGWIDWNLALNASTGGPNWAKLAADAAILVNPSEDEFFKQPIYYAIGHVSKFVPPGSTRIEMKGNDPPRNLHHIAFVRPDNAIVVVFLNKLNYDAKVSLFDERRGTLRIDIPAKSFQTIVYQ